MRTLLSVVVMVAAIALGTELLLRAAIALGVGDLDDPALYAQPFCEDDFHKLRFLWKDFGALQSGRHEQHPRYGWVPVDDEGLARTKVERPHLAVFGDSFMAGVQPLEARDRVARQLDAGLRKGSVSDYSVAGYGVDQIYLRFTDVLANPGWRPDVAIVGIFLGDVDRVVETFRAGPKPYFRIEGEGLSLQGVPIDATPEEWLERNPPAIRSYLAAWLDIRTRPSRGHRLGLETDCLREEKEEITRRLLGRMVEEARQNDVDLIFVINYSPAFLKRISWREKFLRDSLRELDAVVIDIKTLFSEAPGPGESGDYFMPGRNNHYSARGNAVLAQAILDRLQSLEGSSR